MPVGWTLIRGPGSGDWKTENGEVCLPQKKCTSAGIVSSVETSHPKIFLRTRNANNILKQRGSRVVEGEYNTARQFVLVWWL
jgi:hypothetical protein